MSRSSASRNSTIPSGLVLGHIAGAPIVVMPTTVFFALILAASWYPLVNSVLHSLPEALFTVAATVVGTGLAILLHELAHGGTGMLLGRRPQSYTLNLFGGLTTFQVPTGEAPWRSMLVSLAGPAANALLGLACHLALQLPATSLLDSVFVLLWALRWINWALAIFNILPGLPLDGGHALSALITQVTGRSRLGQQVAAAGGFLVVAAIAWQWVLSPLVLYGQRPDTFNLFITVMVGWMIANTCWRVLGWSPSQRAASKLDLRKLSRPVALLPANAPVAKVIASLESGHELVLVADAEHLLGSVDASSVAQLGLNQAALSASTESPVLAGQICTALPAQAVTANLTGAPAAQSLAQARAVSRWLLLLEHGQIIGAVPTGAK